MIKQRSKQKRAYRLLNNNASHYIPFKWLNSIGINKINHDNLTRFLINYFLPLTLGVFIYFIFNIYGSSFDKIFFYFFYLIIIAFCVSFGGLLTGLITTLIILSEIFFIFNISINQSLIETALFTITAIIISILINHARKTKEIKKLKKLEKIYAQTFTDLHSKYIKSRKDIKARDEFLSIVSHELKTPLTTMLLKLHNMLNSVQNISLAKFSIPELMKVLSSAEKQVKQLSSVVNDLLNVSLITTGRMNLQLEICDLKKITKDIIQSFSELLKQEKYKIKVDAELSIIGKWDKARIEQAITNLISNAIKYGQNKPISIKIFSSNGTAKFIIKDQGIGISHSGQNLLFDLFKRAKEAKDYKDGLGVGLYITSQIIKAHGGQIKVSSAPRRGSSFTLELPQARLKLK